MSKLEKVLTYVSIVAVIIVSIGTVLMYSSGILKY